MYPRAHGSTAGGILLCVVGELDLTAGNIYVRIGPTPHLSCTWDIFFSCDYISSSNILLAKICHMAKLKIQGTNKSTLPIVGGGEK